MGKNYEILRRALKQAQGDWELQTELIEQATSPLTIEIIDRLEQEIKNLRNINQVERANFETAVEMMAEAHLSIKAENESLRIEVDHLKAELTIKKRF